MMISGASRGTGRWRRPPQGGPSSSPPRGSRRGRRGPDGSWAYAPLPPGGLPRHRPLGVVRHGPRQVFAVLLGPLIAVVHGLLVPAALLQRVDQRPYLPQLVQRRSQERQGVFRILFRLEKARPLLHGFPGVSACRAGPPAMSVVRPWAILTSAAWFTVQAVLCVTASTSPAADGWPLPLFLTPPKGRCTSAPMHGRFT